MQFDSKRAAGQRKYGVNSSSGCDEASLSYLVLQAIMRLETYGFDPGVIATDRERIAGHTKVKSRYKRLGRKHIRPTIMESARKIDFRYDTSRMLGFFLPF